MANLGSKERSSTQERPSPPEVTARLALFASTLRFEAIPDRAVLEIKRTLLDSLGLALVGAALAPSRDIGDYVAALGGAEEATLWTRGIRVPAVNAALAHGPMIHQYGFDDVHTKLHVASVVVAAALPVAERERVDGRRLLVALVAGYECMVRIGKALDTTRSFLKGWRVTGTVGPFGAAAAAGVLVGLDPAWMASAFGLAGNQSAGLWGPATGDSVAQRFDPGCAAQSGVLAADLARRSVGGSQRILEAEYGGFFAAMSDRAVPAVALDGLGEVFSLVPITNKVIPACISMTSAIEAAQALRQRMGVPPEQIEEIVLKSSEAVLRECGDTWEPVGLMAAQQMRAMITAAYALPVVFIDGDFTLEHLEPAKLASPRVAALSRKVRLELHEELDRRYPELLANIVEIRLADGRVLTERVDHPVGTGQRPLSFEDVTQKFTKLAARAGRQSTAGRIVELVAHLETLGDVSQLTQLLA